MLSTNSKKLVLYLADLLNHAPCSRPSSGRNSAQRIITQRLVGLFEIEGWTHFTFDGRNKAYNDFEWHWYHFNGTDFDAKRNKVGIYLIQGDNKGWADNDLKMVTLTTLCMLT